MKSILSLAMAASLTLLAGCAASPQQVQINPSIGVHSQLATAPAVSLVIEDRRGRTEFGTRGGLYGDRNFILPAADLAASLRPAAMKALTELGARVDAPSPQPVVIRIEIEKVIYRVDPEKKLPVTVNLDASLRVSASRNGETLSGRYSSGKQHQFVTRPSDAENERIINELLSEVLTRAFNDPKLLAFLEQ